MGHAGRLADMVSRPEGAEELLAFFHPARGGADRRLEARQAAVTVFIEQLRLGERFAHGRQGEASGAAEAPELFLRPSGPIRQRGLRALRHAATFDSDGGQRTAGRAPGMKGFPSRGGIVAQCSEATHAGDGDGRMGLMGRHGFISAQGRGDGEHFPQLIRRPVDGSS